MLDRYKSIIYIFTPQEKLELFTFEILNLFEISKRKLEWFVYGLIALIWLCVVCCFVSLSKLQVSKLQVSNLPKTLKESATLALPKDRFVSSSHNQEIIQFKEIKDRERIYEKIKSVSKSELTPEKIYSKVEETSKEWNIDKFFILALLEKECNFNEKAIAEDYLKTGSVGWSQATTETWDTFNSQYVWKKYKTTYSYEDRFDPDKSLEFIGWCLNWMKKYSKYDIETIHDLYACYNAGINSDFKNNEKAQTHANDFLKMYHKYRKNS